MACSSLKPLHCGARPAGQRLCTCTPQGLDTAKQRGRTCCRPQAAWQGPHCAARPCPSGRRAFSWRARPPGLPGRPALPWRRTAASAAAARLHLPVCPGHLLPQVQQAGLPALALPLLPQAPLRACSAACRRQLSALCWRKRPGWLLASRPLTLPPPPRGTRAARPARPVADRPLVGPLRPLGQLGPAHCWLPVRRRVHLELQRASSERRAGRGRLGSLARLSRRSQCHRAALQLAADVGQGR